MSMKLKSILSVLLSLALMIGLLPGMSLTAKAEGTAIKVGDIYKFGDTVVFNGSKQVGDSDSFDGTYTLGYGGTMGDPGDPVVHRIVFTESATSDKYLFLPDPNNDSTEPYGIKAASGSGTRDDPFIFEVFRLVQYNLYVGGKQVTNANASNIDGNNKMSYDDATKTLTLNNFSYSGSDGKGTPNYRNAYIYTTEKLNISLSGTNSITSTNNYPIYTTADLSITGTGTLNVSGYTAIISTGGKVNIEGVTVTATGQSSSGRGISSWNEFSIKNGAKVTATALYGLYCDSSDLTIEESKVTASGNVAGIYCHSGNLTIDRSTVTASGSRKGFYCDDRIYIKEGSTVEASGSEAAVSAGNGITNYIAGTGWTNVQGTEGKELISVGAGQSFGDYKKVQFPEVKDPAKITKEPTANNLTYNGKAQALVDAGTATGGTMNYALGTGSSTAPTEGWSENIPTATDAKTYYVWYKAIGDSEHGDSKADVIEVTIKENEEAHTHKIVHVEAKEPTCTEDGYEAHYKCTECDEWFKDLGGHYLMTETEKTEITKKATGHKWDRGVVTEEATYDETGIKTYTCSVCGETKDETIPVKTGSSSSSSDSSDSSGGGSSGKSGSISTKSIDVNGNTVQTQPDSGAPLSDRGGNWGNQEHIWTYTKSDGNLAKGEWLNLDYNGHTYWYYFDDSTIMQTNWFDYNGSRYFLVPEMDGWRGRMATGWHMVDNKWYYFEPTIGANQGILLRGMTTPDGHTVGADGAWDGNGTTPVGAIHTGTTVTMN